MRSSALSLVVALAVAALCAATAYAAPVDTIGRWRVQVSGGSEFYSGVMVLNQVAQTVIGRAGKSTINGTMVSDTRMEARWNGPKGAGWMTIDFDSNGQSFRGEWGYNGRKADGSFAGKRVAGEG